MIGFVDDYGEVIGDRKTSAKRPSLAFSGLSQRREL